VQFLKLHRSFPFCCTIIMHFSFYGMHVSLLSLLIYILGLWLDHKLLEGRDYIAFTFVLQVSTLEESK
jgi:hypothetical protein